MAVYKTLTLIEGEIMEASAAESNMAKYNVRQHTSTTAARQPMLLPGNLSIVFYERTVVVF